MRHTARIVEGVRFGGKQRTEPLLDDCLSDKPKQQIIEDFVGGELGVVHQVQTVKRALDSTLRSDGYAWSMANIKKSSPVKTEIVDGWREVARVHLRNGMKGQTSMTVSVALERAGVTVAREVNQISSAVQEDLK
jgi:hypothetical protein